MAWSKTRVERLLKDLRTRLAKRNGRRIELTVPANAYLVDDDWLSVVVEPVADNVRAYEYVEELATLEKDLRKAGFAKVVLVPALANS